MFAAALGPALLQGVALLACPESPVWLLRVGQPARAAKALRRLHGRRFRPQDYPKLQQAAEAAAGSPLAAAGEAPLLAAEQGGGEEGRAHEHPLPGWSALWHPRYRRVMTLAAALPLLQQLSGINSIVFFSTEVGRRRGTHAGCPRPSRDPPRSRSDALMTCCRTPCTPTHRRCLSRRGSARPSWAASQWGPPT